MAIAFVQQKAEHSTSLVASFTTSVLTVTASDALAVCLVAWSSHPLTASTTDSQSDGFSTEISELDNVAQLVQWDLATDTVGGSTTVTVTPSESAYITICVQEYSGVALAPVEAVVHAYAPVSADVNPGTLTPPSAGDLYLSAWTHSGSANETFTPNPAWTLRSNQFQNTSSMPLGSEDVIGSGPQIGSATISSVTAWVCVGMALRAGDIAPPDDSLSPNFIVQDFPMANRGFEDEG